MYLELRGLNKSFQRSRAVKDLSLTVGQGEMISLLGPSGCGKTTTLKMIGGFCLPDSGDIFLDGEDITSMAPERRPTATVFQSYALFPHMSVMENVTYGLKFKGIDKDRRTSMGREMLEKVGLPGSGNKGIHQLSGGEQQRVALARSLVIQPKVLLLDEPLSNLDAKLRVKMRAEIRRIQRELGITAVYVTHDQEEAMALSDRIAVMEKGSIVQIGTPQEVYGKPSTPFVADFIGRSNVILSPEGYISVHPEDVVISDEKGDMEGIITDRQYKGAMTTYFIVVGELELEADLPSRSNQTWEKGSRVRVSFIGPHTLRRESNG